MKRIFVLMVCILSFSRYAYCDAVQDALVEAIQSRLEKTVDNDFKKLGYWKDLLINTANNHPETTVSKILTDYSSNPAAMDTALNGLEKLAPEVVGPIGLLISANEALQQSTNNMQEFYKDKRLVEFLDTVIKPAATSQELKKSYDAFKSTAAFAGLEAPERQELESRMRDIFQQRFSGFTRKEKAAESQKLIEQTVSRALKKIRSEVFFKMSLAKDYLTAAAEPVTTGNLMKFINNAMFASTVEAKAREELSKKKAAPPVLTDKKEAAPAKVADVAPAAEKAVVPEAVAATNTTSAAKPVPAETKATTPEAVVAVSTTNAKPEEAKDAVPAKEAVAVAVPAEKAAAPEAVAAASVAAKPVEIKTTAPVKEDVVPVGDSLISKTLQMEMTAAKVGAKVDYAPFLSLYKDAAGRLIDNNISGEIFVDVSKRILQAANTAFNTALANVPAMEKQECRAAYARFTDETNAVRKNIDDKAAAIKMKLEEFASSKEWTPTEYYAQLTANFNAVFSKIKDAADPVIETVRHEKPPSFAFELKRRGGGKQSSPPLPLSEIRSRYQQYAVAVASCSTVIAESERCANLLREKIKSYEPEFKKRYADYGDLYSDNGALADYAGIKFYNFQKEIDGISGAQEMLSTDAGTFVSDGYINGLKRGGALLAKEVENWKVQLERNESFVNSYASLPEKAKPLGVVKGIEKVTSEFFQSYYDKNLRDFITTQLPGAIALLSETTKGMDPAEQVRYGTGEMRLGELAGTKAFASLTEHEKRLKEFRDRIAAMKDMGLDDKGAGLLEIAGKTQKEYDAIELKSAETQKAWNDLEQIRGIAAIIGGAVRVPELSRLYSGAERTLSAKILQSLADQYAGYIARAVETEKKMVETFKKYQENPVKPGEAKQPQDYREAMAAIGIRKWEFSQNVWVEYGKLAKINYDMVAAENRRFTPVRSLMVGDQYVDPAEQQNVEFTAADLRDGEVVIEGKLYPEAVKQMSGLWITLDGGKTKESMPVGESFSYKFKPKEGVVYAIMVIPELVSKEKASSFPVDGKSFNVAYTKVDKDDIVKMYALFKAAYEVKNDTAVLSFFDERWGGAEGANLAALKEHVVKTFRALDEIKFDMSAVNVRRLAAGKYEASYDVVINGKTQGGNAKREEKLSVVEEVTFGNGGKPRITKTISGRFWYK